MGSSIFTEQRSNYNLDLGYEWYELKPRIKELVYKKLCLEYGHYEIIPLSGGRIAVDRNTSEYLFRITSSGWIHYNYRNIDPTLSIFSLPWVIGVGLIKEWIFKLLQSSYYVHPHVRFSMEQYGKPTIDKILSTKRKIYPKISDYCGSLTIEDTNMKESEIKLENLLKEDLGVWFGTKKKPKGSKQPKGPWVNICRKDENGKHPPCGRPEADSKGYPKCRAAGVAGKMSDSEKKSACGQKRREEKKNPKSGTGNAPTMVSHKKKNESISDLVKKVLSEIYDSERLYPKSSLLKRLSSAPKHIRDIVKRQREIPCSSKNNPDDVCVKVPEVVQVYLDGRY